jgi:hypothetical protein
MFEDGGLRDVRMTSGRALGYVQPETASQILCQLLDKDEWERLLDGPVGRRPITGPNGGCHVATAEGGVIVELRGSDDALEPDTTIAGRPARQDVSRASDGITVALTDDALRPAPRQYYPERRLLSATSIVDDPETELELAERVLEEIVPLVLEDGEELPDVDDGGYVRYVDTPLTGHFVDLPTPVQRCSCARSCGRNPESVTSKSATPATAASEPATNRSPSRRAREVTSTPNGSPAVRH